MRQMVKEGKVMKSIACCLALLSVMLCFVTSCGKTINADNLKKLRTKEYRNYTLYYDEILPADQIQDYDTITDNMYSYLTTKMGLDFNKPHFNVAVLPLENDVVQFRKRSTNACTDYENIYIVDMFNLPEEMYEKYGPPPEGIANNAFTHELAHLMTHGVIDYKKGNKNRPEEMNSFCLGFIDFTIPEFKLLYDLADIVNGNISEVQYRNLMKNGLISLKGATEDASLAVFLLYLHMNEEYGRVRAFLEANDLEDFINKANWGTNDDKLFNEWLDEYYNANTEPVAQ